MSDSGGPIRMVDHALRYAGIGWPVFPLASSGDLKLPHSMLGKHEPGGPLVGQHLATVDAATIRKWWSRDPAAGIGVHLAPAGLVAVDLDPTDGGDGALAAQEARHGALASPVRADTGGGGQHRIFAAPQGARIPGKLAKGVDLKYNGYIVLPPSRHSRRQKAADGTITFPVSPARYRWQKGADPFEMGDYIMPLPDWALKAGSNLPPTPSTAVARTAAAGEDPFAEVRQKCNLSIEKMGAILEDVPNDDGEQSYDDWLNVLAGIYHETDGSDEGKQLAYAWSIRASKHDDEKFEKSWRSLDIQGKGRQPVTFRFAIKLASAARGESGAEDANDIRGRLQLTTDMVEFRELCARIKRAVQIDRLDRDNLVQEVRATFKRIMGNPLPIGRARELCRPIAEATAVPDWLVGWSYCSREGLFFRSGSDEAITKHAFNDRYDIHMLTFADKAAGRAVPETHAADAALNLWDIPKVYGRMYLPSQPAFFDYLGAPFVNTFNPLTMPEVPATLTVEDRAAIKLVVEHFVRLTGCLDDAHMLLSWIAYIVQTLERVNWAPIIQGPEKTGKSFLTGLIMTMLGAQNVGVVHATTLESPFNDWAEGKLVVIIEEIRLHGESRYSVIDKMKPLITNAVIEIHPKGLRSRSVPNTASFGGYSNYRDALPLDNHDTRYWLIAAIMQLQSEVEAFHAENPTYYRDLYGTLARAGALRKYFLEYVKHPGFDAKGRAPYSAEKATMVNAAKSDAEDTIEEALRVNGRPGITARLLDSDALADLLTEDDIQVPQTSSLRYMLTNRLGFHPLGRFKVNGRKRRFFTREKAEFARLNSDELAAKIRDILKEQTDPAEGL